MSKTRKILSLLIAVVMVFGVFSVCAFAAGNIKNDSDDTHTQTWALSEPVKNNDGSWSVDVKLTTNYPTGTIQFVVKNDDGNATLTGVKLGAAVPASYNADISKGLKGKVMITPKTSTVASLAGVAIDGVVATLTYTVADGKQATIAIENNPKTAENVDGTLIAACCKDVVSSDLLIGQTVTSTGVSRTLGTAANPELYVIEGTGGVIDTTRNDLNEEGDGLVNGYLYGVEPEEYQAITDVFDVKNGEIEIVDNSNECDCGTGTLVQVKNKDGTVVETYVLVLFGDVDGDGSIGTFDSTIIDLHDSYMLETDSGRIESPVILLAGDVDFDGDVTTFDSTIIDLHDSYMLESDSGRLMQADMIDLLS